MSKRVNEASPQDVTALYNVLLKAVEDLGRLLLATPPPTVSTAREVTTEEATDNGN